MSISFKAFGECVGFVTKIKKPVLLRGRHGVGKSCVVYEYANYIKLPVIERRASQMTEGDLLGLPKLSNGRTEWIPPSWLKDACESPCVLFIDEIDRATTEVRQGFFELCDSRKIAGWYLHEDTLIFAAVNGGDSGSQYQVGEMDPAELDRWTVFDVEPTVEDWISWGRQDNNIHPMITEFIMNSPNHLEHTTDFEPNKIYPSRRSWHRFSECIVAAGEKLFEPGKVSGTLFNVAQAFLGLEAAVSFQDFVRTYSTQLSAEDILIKGMISSTNKYDINDHNGMIDKLDVYLKNEKNTITDEMVLNLGKYFITTPSECAMSLWEKIGVTSSGDEAVELALRFHKLKNPDVSAHLLKILTESPIVAKTADDDDNNSGGKKKNKKNKKKNS